MKYAIILFILILLFSCENSKYIAGKDFDFASGQFILLMIETEKRIFENPGKNYIVLRLIAENNTLIAVSSYNWTSSFFAGKLWYVHEGPD
jgi:hypothetical protein